MTSIPLSLCDEGTRARKDYGDLTGLKDSISRLGTLHPPVFSRQPNGTYLLIYGGRRFRSLKELGVTELFHNSILDPLRPGFMFVEDVATDLRMEAELDENLHRLKPKWQEDVLLVADIHERKRQLEGSKHWGQNQTALLLGGKWGKNNVGYALRAAKEIRAADKEILGADSLGECVEIWTKRKADEGLKILQARLMTAPMAMMPPSTSSFLEEFTEGPDVEEPQFHGAVKALLVPLAAKVTPPLTDIPLSRMLFLRDSIMDPEPWPLVDHVITDIPYGIDMDNLENVGDVKAEHYINDNVDLMPPFLSRSFNAVRDGGFCVFFYDLQHHEKLLRYADMVGWAAQRWPLIVTKSSPCRNGAAQYNFTKNYECVMVLRKPGAVLRKPQASSVLPNIDFRAESAKYNHPFAKPFIVWQWLYSAFTIPGQSVLDPYCGEMSACSAAVSCGLIPYGMESVEQHFNRGLQHMRETYAKVHGGNVRFV